MALHRLLESNPRYFRLLLSNRNFRSSFTCAEAFIIAAYCGFNEEALDISANRSSLDWNWTDQDYELDLQRNVEISNAQAIHGIRMAFSIGESQDDYGNSRLKALEKSAKMSMIEPNAISSGYPESCPLQNEKVIALSNTENMDAVTFSIKDEDHTIGNALRWIIMKNPNVSFCGYSIPHPSEFKIHLRIQTDGTITAYQALDKGLTDLMNLGQEIQSAFLEASK